MEGLSESNANAKLYFSLGEGDNNPNPLFVMFAINYLADGLVVFFIDPAVISVELYLSKPSNQINTSDDY